MMRQTALLSAMALGAFSHDVNSTQDRSFGWARAAPTGFHRLQT